MRSWYFVHKWTSVVCTLDSHDAVDDRRHPSVATRSAAELPPFMQGVSSEPATSKSGQQSATKLRGPPRFFTGCEEDPQRAVRRGKSADSFRSLFAEVRVKPFNSLS